MFDPVRDGVPACLVLENGAIFRGYSCGAPGRAMGEVVFNTAMTGYQEVLTDPSYCGQMIAFTYPHIGNVGFNKRDNESRSIWAEGLIVRDLVSTPSNYRAVSDLHGELVRQGVVAISGVNTRALTHMLREQGALRGLIQTGDHLTDHFATQQAVSAVKALEPLSGQDLTGQVTTKAMYSWLESSDPFRMAFRSSELLKNKRVVVYDFGVKYSILRLLRDRGLDVLVVPARTPLSELSDLKPDGIVLSNGPGDPAAALDVIALIRQLVDQPWPILGICLGYQMLALAVGAETYKMKFGHHGANHPIQNEITRQVRITSQNHGFAVNPDTLPDGVYPTHWALFDGTLQGFRFKNKPILAFQGHPEAGPGPHEMVEILDEFVELLSH